MKTFGQIREFLMPGGSGRGGGGGDDHWNSFVKTLYTELKKIGFSGKLMGGNAHVFVKEVPKPAGVGPNWPQTWDAIIVDRDDQHPEMFNYFFGEMKDGVPNIDFAKDSHTAVINTVAPTVVAGFAKTRFVGWPRQPGKFGPTRRADYVAPVKNKRRK